MKTLDQLIDEQRERAKGRRGGHASNLRLVPVPPKRARKQPKQTPEQSRAYREAKYAKWRALGIVA